MSGKDQATEIDQDFALETEVSRLLGIGVPSLRNRIYAGKNHPPFIPGAKKLFPRDELNKWLRSRMQRELAS